MVQQKPKIAVAGLSIRTFAEGDLDAAAALVTELGYPTTRDQMRQRMAAIASHPDHATFVAVADGRVVAMVGASVTPSYEHDGSTGRINAMVVSEAARGQGIGARLVATAEDWASDRGAEVMMLNSHIRRDGAHAFYRRLGYSETGKRFVRSLV
jgi:GNAT superfamily N-acetyltransferase